MKKLLFIVVSLLFTSLSYSQSVSKVLRSAKLEYKESEWVKTDEQYPEDYFVILDGYNVTIGTYKFRTYGESEKTTYDDHIVLTWKCINGNGDKCLFMMKKFKPEVTTHTIFGIGYESGIIYEYETED